MTPKPQANRLDEMPVFGDKVSIEQFRYGADNEFYTHKVIGTFRSNTYADVPQTGGYEQYIHKETVDVVQVICEGISEDKVLRYPVARVKILGHRQALITEARIDELERTTDCYSKNDNGVGVFKHLRLRELNWQLKENK